MAAASMSEKCVQRADNLHGQNNNIDQKDTKQHHHRILLHLFWTLGSLFLQIALFHLAHIEGKHSEIHLLVIASEGSD